MNIALFKYKNGNVFPVAKHPSVNIVENRKQRRHVTETKYQTVKLNEINAPI